MSKICPNCGFANRDNASFCAACGAQLDQPVEAQPSRPLICSACGAANPPNAHYCVQCAASLGAGSGPIAGSTTGMLLASSMLAGRYLIIQRVGQGGMGAVYKATDTRLGQKLVAVKELSEVALTVPLERQQAREAFEQEAQMLAKLNHTNLPRVMDHFSEGGKQYLVMDFIEGQTFENMLNQASGPLDIGQVTGWAGQLCDVLEYLHDQQPPIIFRDLKPGNIMLDKDGSVKLIDFGIARLFKPGKSADTTSFGTAGYAPPEQYGKEQTDARSDIYALGATLHQLLTGRDPSQTPFQFPAVRSLNPKVPEHVEQAITKALAQDPGQRWPSARQMKQALTAPPPRPAVQAAAPAPVVSVSPYVAAPTPKFASAPAAKPVQPAAKKRAAASLPVKRSGFWSTLFVSALLAGLLWYAVQQPQVRYLLGSDGPWYPLWIALFWVPGPLAYMLTRQPLAPLLTGGVGFALPLALNGGRALDLGDLFWSLLPDLVMAVVFVRGSRRRPTCGALILAAVLAQAVDLAILVYLRGTQLPPLSAWSWLTSSSVGIALKDRELLSVANQVWYPALTVISAFVGSTIAFIIGKIFRR